MYRKNKLLSFLIVILVVIGLVGLLGTITKGFTHLGPFQKHNMLFNEGDKIILTIQKAEGGSIFVVKPSAEINKNGNIKTTNLEITSLKEVNLITYLYDWEVNNTTSTTFYEDTMSYVLTMEYSENGYYYLKNYFGNYLSFLTPSSNTACFSEQPYELNIIENEDNSYSIYSVIYPTRQFQLLKSGTSNYCAFYESKQVGNFQVHIVNDVDTILNNYIKDLEGLQ